jgi:sugar/nucleoside kinase (ribokinase family)
VDTTGAGDNFVAGFLFARANGRSYSDCARFANAIASLCVEHIGATTHMIHLSEVVERCHESFLDFEDFRFSA